MKKRVLALTLLFILIAVTLIAPTATAEETTSASPVHILGETIDVFPEDREDEGFVNGGATGHGNNQTRILAHETGIYFSAPLNDFDDSDDRYGTRSEAGVWRLNFDGSVEMLFRFDIFNIAAGTTSNIMADRDGLIWTASSWQGSKYVVYSYDPATNEVQEYAWDIVSLPKGSKGITAGGKPGAIMDTTFNRIYEFSLGEFGKKTYIVWNVFDIETKTWSGLFNVLTPTAQTCYHFGYADGKGGFFATAETAISLQLLPSGNDAVNLKEALRVSHSFYHNAAYVWMNSDILYVPDAMKAEAYNSVVLEMPYDVEKGIISNNSNAKDDLFWDKETGYLYSIVTYEERGTAPDRNILQVFDTNQKNEDIQADGPFKLIAQTELHFMYGDTYFSHMYKDTTGRLYIIGHCNHRGAIEILQAQDNPATDFRLVHVEDFRGFLDADIGNRLYSSIIATDRNNSVVTDTAHLIVNVGYHGWVYFNVDFAALRAMLGQN